MSSVHKRNKTKEQKIRGGRVAAFPVRVAVWSAIFFSSYCSLFFLSNKLVSTPGKISMSFSKYSYRNMSEVI